MEESGGTGSEDDVIDVDEQVRERGATTQDEE